MFDESDHPLRLGAQLAVDLGLAAAFTVGGAALRLVASGLNPLREPEHSLGRSQLLSKGGAKRSPVTAEDGAELHVEVDGDLDAPVTVVLCHGFALNQDSWSAQRAELGRHARLVLWDQRGHGRSQRGLVQQLSIDQLSRDLFAVLEQVVPTGPVVLVGHSMGGMTVMALAGQHPELFGSRVRGVALLATSGGPISADLGLPPYAARALQWAAPGAFVAMSRLLDPGWGARDVVRWLTRRYAFAPGASEELVVFLAEMIQATPFEVLAGLFPDFRLHHSAGLGVLQRVKTLVMAGERDQITPPSDGLDLLRAVPNADLVVVPDAGHGLILERPELVNAHLSDLIKDVTTVPSLMGADAG
ncbi:alpha/beta hydrolase [Saccharopolyspora spinosa]|uniref:Pimeloyl-ACP methyl ester carboxylesterase n=1 Tax=Saccharopolyspora spinosa TaxID=60894 RepID=A0A2N3Y1Q9_SACSN|nr:alpha/beta hydrolase [Saccharopolyspora spinosa]PKW16820.1 pimeloyl-ACP methyl ester carboxylesterase [Saccharopolyspora spinosa]